MHQGCELNIAWKHASCKRLMFELSVPHSLSVVCITLTVSCLYHTHCRLSCLFHTHCQLSVPHSLSVVCITLTVVWVACSTLTVSCLYHTHCHLSCLFLTHCVWVVCSTLTVSCLYHTHHRLSLCSTLTAVWEPTKPAKLADTQSVIRVYLFFFIFLIDGVLCSL